MSQGQFIVFDVDKTLIDGNLHEHILDRWCEGSRWRSWLRASVPVFSKLLPLATLRRRVEYFATQMINARDMGRLTSEILSDGTATNLDLVRRIRRYRRLDYTVVLVSAAPQRVVAPLGRQLGLPVFGSTCICGLVVRDLLARKARVYRVLERTAPIKRVYSDSELDFWSGAKNYLVTDRKLSLG